MKKFLTAFFLFACLASAMPFSGSSHPELNTEWADTTSFQVICQDGPWFGSTLEIDRFTLFEGSGDYRTWDIVSVPYLSDNVQVYWSGSEYSFEVKIYEFDDELMPVFEKSSLTISFDSTETAEEIAAAFQGVAWSCGGIFGGDTKPPWYDDGQGWPDWCPDGVFPGWYDENDGNDGIPFFWPDAYNPPDWIDFDQGNEGQPDGFDFYNPPSWFDENDGNDGIPDWIPDPYDPPDWFDYDSYNFPDYFDPYDPPDWWDPSEAPPVDNPEPDIQYSLSTSPGFEYTSMGVEFTVLDNVYDVKLTYCWRVPGGIWSTAGVYSVGLGYYEYSTALAEGTWHYRIKVEYYKEMDDTFDYFYSPHVEFDVGAYVPPDPDDPDDPEVNPFFSADFEYPDDPIPEFDDESSEDWRMPQEMRSFDSDITMWKLLPPGSDASFWQWGLDLIPSAGQIFSLGSEVDYDVSYVLDFGTVDVFGQELHISFDYSSFSTLIQGFRSLATWALTLAFVLVSYTTFYSMDPSGITGFLWGGAK